MFTAKDMERFHHDAIGYPPELRVQVAPLQQAMYERMAALINAQMAPLQGLFCEWEGEGVIPLEAGVEMAQAVADQAAKIQALQELLLDIVAFLQMHPPGLTSPFQETPEPVREWLAERDDLVSRIRKLSEGKAP